MSDEMREHVDAADDRSFEKVLRAAIQRSGLGLERIRHRLAQRGCQVSVATLSHWQSGRRRPERPESMMALALLEEVLALPEGALTCLLGPPRPRGLSRNGQRRLPAETVWSTEPRIPALLRSVESEDEYLVRLSQHNLVRLSPQGAEQSVHVRLVLRATRSGVSRLSVVCMLDRPHPRSPELRPLRHCSVDTATYLPDEGYLVASVAFDRELARGDSLMVEYEVRHPASPHPSTYWENKLRFPVHEYYVEVAFDPRAVPSRCAWQVTGDKDVRRGGEALLDGSHCVQLALSDAAPGCYRISWEW
ncbi:hypothetical protein LX15_000820 [Streptoalloteichus tenebrarius]|uniref:XRE family transcriptional regulator n=1 Tax=Streptoalloteichus tenebrarius (strain ATCC 17920 / DSM 40477 / JCM 4838 / CBS 697.72 / NBRC 16177 / NCIMB 11028 / NRRL B-12390 / A12253. 1 / ISP 5477) TaxID=1933 RepID=A0ABT1HNS2_STRSD|nr:XRE family transcriptional regulator [Streptoalloteichus tenebrarius]MCP2257135.1 hypothetical protein [Streptoalloteichus tenebrarius]BFE98767.1 hypothetical protein GCM10020241_04430 [Streptoalloteichus tenebrarius]